MKTFKISLSAVAFIFVLFACNNDDEDIKILQRNAASQPEKVTGNFELKLEERYIGGNFEQVEISAHLKGEGDLNHMSDAILELDHSTIVKNKNGEQSLFEGYFRIWNEGGAQIFGIYSDLTKYGEYMKITAEIKGGSGIFSGVHGNLLIELIRENDNNFKAIVNGQLYGYKPLIVD